MSEPKPTLHNTETALATGDDLAASGDWRNALAAWREAVVIDASLRSAVEQRLTWLLVETGQPTSRLGVGGWPLVLASGVAAMIAVVCVLIPDDPGSAISNVWAALAWIFILISAVTTVVAARAPRRHHLEQLMQRAMDVVARLDEPQGNGKMA